MKLAHGTFKRLAEKTGYTADYVRAVYRGKRRNAILEALLEVEAEKAAAAERRRRRIERIRKGGEGGEGINGGNGINGAN